MKTKLRLIGIVWMCLAPVSIADAAIRIVAYNCENRPNDATQEASFSTVFQAAGNESVNGISKRLDILVMSEMDDDSANSLTSLLNTLYGVNTYRSELSSSAGGDRTGVIYDSSTLDLICSTDLTNIGTRPVLRAQFRPLGSTAANEEFYVYAIHLKSGTGATNINRRANEAANLRADADALGQGIPIIYAGDLNITSSSEGAWTNMLAPGNGQADDAADSPGEWRDDATFRHLHTQNPRAAMDDRFDFIFISGELVDGNGIEYLNNSFRVFGNDGTHTINDEITTGTGASANVLNALEAASDHLPVVADFTVVGAQPNTRQQILQRIDEIQQELIQLRALAEQLP